MKPTTIYLPEDTEITLQEIAKQKGKTLSEIIQEMVKEMVKEYSLIQKKSLPDCVGMGNSGISDLSERVDELLWQDR